MKFEIVIPNRTDTSQPALDTFLSSMGAYIDYNRIDVWTSISGVVTQQQLIWGKADSTQMPTINGYLATMNTSLGTSVLINAGGYQNVMGQVTTILNLASAARASYTSGQLSVDAYQRLALDINITAFTGGTNPTALFRVSRVGADGILYTAWQSKAVSVASKISQTFGSPIGSPDVGNLMQVDLVTTGAPTSVTFSGSLLGRSFA